MTLVGLLWPALVVVEAVAVVVALRRVPRSPLVLLLLYALADEVLVEALHRWAFAGAPRPFAGGMKVLYFCETALVLGWPAGLAATSWQVSAPLLPRSMRRDVGPMPLVLGGVHLGAVVGLAVAYPLPRARLASLLHAWEVLCVVLAWAGVRRGWRRAWGRVEVAIVVLVSCETMIATVGPFASDPFTRWWIGAVFYLVTWLAVVVVLARRSAPRR